MTGWSFWAVAVSLGLGVALVLIAALRRVPGTTGGGEADLAVYRDQLSEIDRDVVRGTIGPDEAARLRAEVGKRVLEADRLQCASDDLDTLNGGSNFLFVVILAFIIPSTLLAYAGSISIFRALGAPEDRISALKEQYSFVPSIRGVAFPKISLIFNGLGAPGYPDMALGPRIAALDAGIAARRSQEAELAALKAGRDAALDGSLKTELAAMNDPAALRDLFRKRFEAGALQASVRVQERLLALEGDAAGSADHANLALALVAEAQGYVSPEAETELRESLQKDMTNELARYLVGEMFLQGGRYDQAFRFWRPLAESGDPAAPWTQSIRDRIVEVAGLAGIRYSLPDAKGPSAGDVAAAGEMAPEDRQKMIEGMVAQLSDRLATDGGTVEEWNKLIRSLTVLGRTPEAQKIYDEAKVKFAGQSAELSFLRLAAVESGLTP